MDQNLIRTRSQVACHICDTEGTILYDSLTDKLFGAPGVWRLRRCTAASCGLMWLDPMPLAEDLWIAYREYYTHTSNSSFPATWPRGRGLRAHLQKKYGYPIASYNGSTRLAALAAALKPHRMAEVEFNVMYLPFIRGGRLLEVGCGSGAMLELMNRLGWDAEGIDFDSKAVTAARSRGLKVALGSLEQQTYANESFDAITTSHLIEHVPNPSALVEKMLELLKPGGRLVVVTPNTASMGSRIFGRTWRGLEPPRHLHIFTPQSLRQLVCSAGFEIEKLDTTIRNANGMFAASLSLRTSEPRATPPSQSVAWRAFARSLQIVEWLGLHVIKNLGEEIALVARKPDR